MFVVLVSLANFKSSHWSSHTKGVRQDKSDLNTRASLNYLAVGNFHEKKRKIGDVLLLLLRIKSLAYALKRNYRFNLIGIFIPTCSSLSVTNKDKVEVTQGQEEFSIENNRVPEIPVKRE